MGRVDSYTSNRMFSKCERTVTQHLQTSLSVSTLPYSLPLACQLSSIICPRSFLLLVILWSIDKSVALSSVDKDSVEATGQQRIYTLFPLCLIDVMQLDT